jgi:hypothetical protein
MRLAANLFTGLAAGLGAVLWLGVPELSALNVGHALAAIASAAVATLTGAIGGLMVSDWQADVQSRHDWVQAGLTSTELSTYCDVPPARDIDPSYQSSSVNTDLQAIFRAHWSSVPVQCDETRAARPEAAARPASGDHVSRTADLSRAAARCLALRRSVFCNTGRMGRSHQSAKLHVKQLARAVRLVANGASWQPSRTRDVRATPCVVFSAGRAENVVRLSNSEDGELPVAGGVTDLAPETPSCRGPPSIKRGQLPRHEPATSIRPRAKREAAPAVQGADPVVRDDLGQEVPVCAAELNVIEVYLGHLLADVFESLAADEEGA